MSSLLSVPPRPDVFVVPGLEASHGTQFMGGVETLWSVLQATSIDVADSEAKSIWAFASAPTCIYLAHLIKAGGPSKHLPRPPPLKPSVPVAPSGAPALKEKPRKTDRFPYGNVRSGWTHTPPTISALMKMKAAYSDEELKYIRKDLRRRSIQPLAGDIGLLVKYNSIQFDREHRSHGFIFQNAIVVATDGPDGFSSMNFTKVSHAGAPLTIQCIIPLSQVEDVVPTIGPWRSSTDIFGLDIKHGDNITTVGIHGLASAASWGVAIARLIFRRQQQLENASVFEDVELAEDYAAFTVFARVLQTFIWHLPMPDTFGPVLLHDMVTIRDNKSSTTCAAILFGELLFFVSGNGPPLANRYLKLPRVTRIYRINPPAGIHRFKVGLTHTTEYPDHFLDEEYVFEVSSSAAATKWYNALASACPHLDLDPDMNDHYDPLPALNEALEKANATAIKDGKTFERRPPDLAGIIFLTLSPGAENEYNLTVAINPDYTGEGLGTEAIAHALTIAFEQFGAHRVQARVVHSARDPTQTAHAVRKFVHLGFSHEGVRRRAVIHPVEQIWADMSVLAILDSDWTIRDRMQPPTGTLWDELFARQLRERESLLRMEGGELRRTKSMETVRDLRSMADAAPTASVMGDDVGISLDDSRSAASRSVSDAASMSSWDAVSSVSSEASSAASHVAVVTTSGSSGADDAADEYGSEWDVMDDDDDEDNEDYESDKDK